ncbi:MFS transporter [Kingella negevensis]|uniref:MFS transporter n=1 Tax=Kingella negevensis TaxID=1522312 RepID=UPI00050A1111|nr:MFS transporter [Kingella negevensis]MDK4688870.1 MFS transporter [Kingella negevensis]WII92074.1 MFS transporter [Kingella negevensis]
MSTTTTFFHSSTPELSEQERQALRKAATSSFIGNFVEWFDYAAYGYLAAIIGKVFFPSSDPQTELIATFTVFAISFIIRPFGGIVWGYWGDRYGRRFALSWSILVMSASTFCIALIPSYTSIGIAAPILLLLVRMVQGFSASGEYAGASAFLAEYAPKGKRGLYTSLVPASTATGLLMGSLLAALLYTVLSPEHLHSWGWRIPFLMAGPFGLIGRYIRLHLEDSPVYREMEAKMDKSKRSSNLPIQILLTKYRKEVLIACGVVSLNAVAFYTTLSYMPTYLSSELGMSETYSFMASSVALLAYIGFIFVMGHFSDLYGRKTMLTGACVLFILLSVPLFALLEQNHFAVSLFVMMSFGVILAMNDGTLPGFLTEAFPTHLRFSGFALCFNMGNALLGGTSPLLATLLIKHTGSDLAPAWYLSGIAVIALIALRFSQETANKKL